MLTGLRPGLEPDKAACASSSKGGIGEAIRFLRSNRLPRLVISAEFLLMLSGGALNALFVVYAYNALGLGPEGYGIMIAALGAGALGASALTATLGVRVEPQKLFFFGILIAALAPIAWALTRELATAVAISLFNGAANAVLGIAGDTILQRSIPSVIRGRVLSVGMTAITASSLVSMGLAGYASDIIGVRNVFVLGGGVALLGVIIAGAVIKSPLPPAGIEDSA